MNRASNRSFFVRQFFQLFGLTLTMGAASFVGLADPKDNSFPSGIRNSSSSRRLNLNQQRQIRDNLRKKTGFVEIEFDGSGVLTLGNRQNISGGSATARALLVITVDSGNLYELESHDRSPIIAFARIAESEDRVEDMTGKRTKVFQVQLDFTDFSHLAGAPEAKAAFDLGFSLLHELVHGVLKLKDPRAEGQIGECDAHINQIRRELRLPERLYYHPRIAVVELRGSRLIYAHLEFIERSGSLDRPSAKYRLTWLVGRVMANAQYVAQL